MVKISCVFLFLFLSFGIGFSEQDKVKIVFCDDYFCTQMPTGEEYKIVKQVDWAANKVMLSPDEKYVAYTASNWLGFENEGRDVFYCKVDGSDRIFLHKFEICVDTLLWESYGGKTFIFVVPKNCSTGPVRIQILDLQSKDLIFTCLGDSLIEVPGTDCYEAYDRDAPPWAERQRICSHDLADIKEPDSLNMRFFIGWGNWDIYLSSQRDQILRFNELSKSTIEQEQKLRGVMFSEQFANSKIIPNQKNNRIIFSGDDMTSGFYGVIDTESKQLLLFDKRDSSKFSNASWSPDGNRFAVLRMNNWQTYIDFNEIDEKGEVNLFKTYGVSTDQSISDFRWSEDSKRFYFSYLGNDQQKIEEQVDLTK